MRHFKVVNVGQRPRFYGYLSTALRAARGRARIYTRNGSSWGFLLVVPLRCTWRVKQQLLAWYDRCPF